MPSPWLEISLDDYEAHMQHPDVGQLAVLAELFREALRLTRPESVAILGVAGGNGLDGIDTSVTRRVVGIDINATYLDSARRRFSGLGGLEFHCLDLAHDTISLAPVALVHAALIFEHAGTERCLENALKLVASGGSLSVVLQLPAAAGGQVGSSGIGSVQALAQEFTLISGESLVARLAGLGYELRHEATRPLPGAKGFWMGIFTRR